jgi:hypothetical protein
MQALSKRSAIAGSDASHGAISEECRLRGDRGFGYGWWMSQRSPFRYFKTSPEIICTSLRLTLSNMVRCRIPPAGSQ